MGQACRRIQRLEQRGTVELLVELTQVIEGDARLGQGGHGFAPGGVGQVAQHTISQPLVRHLAQLFLMPLMAAATSCSVSPSCGVRHSG